MSQASRRHALAPKRERLSVIKFIARADPDSVLRSVSKIAGVDAVLPPHAPGIGAIAVQLNRIDGDQPFDVAKVRAEAELVRLYGKHAHRVKRRHDVDSRGRNRWASPVGDWADEAPGVPWPYMDGDDLALVRVAEAVLRAIDGQPSECMSCVAEDASLDDVLETMVRLKLRQEQRRSTIYLQAKTWHRMHSTMVDEARTRTAADVLVAVASTVNVAIADPCPVCNGSRENLRGDLGLIDVSPQLLRRMTEGEGGYYADTMAPWLTSVAAIANDEAQALELIGPAGSDPRARVVARGEHRHHGAVPGARQAWMDAAQGSEEREAALDLLISERRWDVWGDDGRPYAVEPRWFRGEMVTIDRRQAAPTRRFIREVQRELAPAFQNLMRELSEFMETGR